MRGARPCARSALAALTIMLGAPAPSALAEVAVRGSTATFPGPYVAQVMRVIDGDTIEVGVALWPGLRAEYSVRIRGIDAPEIHGPACDEELDWGREAKAQAERLYPPGLEVRLHDVAAGAFSGRVIADVKRWRSDRWLSFAAEMLDRKMAVEWTPGQNPVPWCLLAGVR